MCSEFTPRARIPDTRIPQFMQPWRQWYQYSVKLCNKIVNESCSHNLAASAFDNPLRWYCVEHVKNTRSRAFWENNLPSGDNSTYFLNTSKWNPHFYSLLFRYAVKRKKRYYLGIFPNMGGGGLPKSQNFFCKFTKYFFVCQIHSEVLKHVLQMGG